MHQGQALRKVQENKNDNIIIRDNDGPIRAAEEQYVPKYFVSRFCDESKTIGFCYILADGTVGLIMKDKSRWVM